MSFFTAEDRAAMKYNHEMLIDIKNAALAVVRGDDHEMLGLVAALEAYARYKNIKAVPELYVPTETKNLLNKFMRRPIE